MHRGDQRGNGQYLGPDPYFDDLFCHGRRHGASCRASSIVDTETSPSDGPVQTLRINRLMVDGVVEAPHGAHFTECVPDYGRDEAFQKEYAARREDRPRRGTRSRPTYLDCDRGRVPAGGGRGAR